MKRFLRTLNTALKTILITLTLLAAVGSIVLAVLCYNVPNTTPDINHPLAKAFSSFFPDIHSINILGGNAIKPAAPVETGNTVPETTVPETTIPETTVPPTTLPPEPEHVISTATIGATGDMLMHLPVIDSGKRSDGNYNFDYMFRYLRPYTSSVDYAVANLETTLCSNTNGFPYKGYPQFNCPDEIVDSLRDAGFDMLLTANNHSYDTGQFGYNRTIEVVRGRGLATLGTMLNGEEPKYEIVDLNGIKVGMLCYTYASIPEGGYANRVYLNGILMHQGAEEVVNSFVPENPAPFYEEVAGYLDQMRADGAEATVIFMHWGVEYTTQPVSSQTQMAQKLCDLGFDVIVGGHPHVVEPVALLTSSVNPEHKTVCLYSMGNAVSNQRAGVIEAAPYGYTEDGVWFTMTFSKYSDGTVFLDNVDLMPCWVELRTDSGRQYNILPLDAATMDSWKTAYEIQDMTVSAAKRSYDRTMGIVGAGLTESQQYLAEQKQIREDNYWALANAA